MRLRVVFSLLLAIACAAPAVAGDGAPHWSFVAPKLSARAQRGSEIDSIVDARLNEVGLSRSTEASRHTLIRRVTLDLTGLPPTPEEVDAFLCDTRADAYERVVDRLLASLHYGEKMALPWLDAARYADSNGFQQDGDTFQWLWRDWLVRELNADTPYNELSIAMLAGDLLPDATDQTRLATAFNRHHLLNGEGGAIAEENRFVAMFDRIDATATTWLGLTMSCAQCHDHKFDPITTRDYYGMLDAFKRLPESGIVDGSPSRFRIAPPILEVADSAQQSRRALLAQAVNNAGATRCVSSRRIAARDGDERRAAAANARAHARRVLESR